MPLNDFSVAVPRPLPVFVLADTSGSMAGAKIESLNAALREMVAGLQSVDDSRGQTELAIITFGKTVECVQPLQPVRDIVLPELTAGGKTPMGNAFDLLGAMLQDETIVPARAFNPSLVLVSDGIPTDAPVELRKKMEADTATKDDFLQWDKLAGLLSSRRGKDAMRLAMSIGDDSQIEMLQAFVNTPGVPIFRAQDAYGISKFFRWVTMSVSTRISRRNPNAMAPAVIEGFDEDEFVL